MVNNEPPSITVKSYPNNYNIYIGNFLKSNLLTKFINIEAKVIIIYDIKLKYTFLPLLLNSINKSKISYTCVSIKAKEKNKNFKTVNFLLNKILNLNINRQATIIALGGGIIGDISGFVSAILLRGINFISIPTTLLSAIDSSVGGKNGVNHKQGKNLIGTFYNPQTIILDPLVFSTLPKRQIASGFAEIIKCSLIDNKPFFDYLNNNYFLLYENNLNFLEKIIEYSIFTKKVLVELDYFDTNNRRALLNLGHTFGHALELINNYHNSLTHGEAVSIGLCLAAKFSSYINLLDITTTYKIINLIKKVNLPCKFLPLINNEPLQKKFILAMLKDKKNTNHNINLVLLQDIGKASLVKNIPIIKITNFINSEYSTCGFM